MKMEIKQIHQLKQTEKPEAKKVYALRSKTYALTQLLLGKVH